MISCKVTVEKTLYGAVGAALNLLQDLSNDKWYPTIAGTGVSSADDLLIQRTAHKVYYHAPLTLQLSNYPDFTSSDHYEFQWSDSQNGYPVEVDVYQKLDPGATYDIYLGIDIGSTSTKAVVLDDSCQVRVGVYTATAGDPAGAVGKLMKGLGGLGVFSQHPIAGVATTGSGRKLVRELLRADMDIDEITAHARAAVFLTPAVDTILEIGGQDSKFTRLKDGEVYFSTMNYACAAGTGSFVEEQAQRLGVPVVEYGERTRGHASPLASERCTVFMERDLNHYLREGYETNEVLAAVLHSVRENYLNKVAVEPAMASAVRINVVTVMTFASPSCSMVPVALTFSPMWFSTSSLPWVVSVTSYTWPSLATI